MPYVCRKVGDRHIVHKKNDNGQWVRIGSSGSHGSSASCQRQVRALYSKENAPQAEDSSITGAIKGQLTLKNSGTIRINSPGGDLMAAIDAANFIRQHGLPTILTGQAASAAVLPLIAGSNVKAMSNTLIMIHNPRAVMQGVYTSEELEEKKEAIDKACEIYANEIKARVSPMSALMVDDWLKKDTYFTAEEALAHGLIDEIVPVHSRNVDVNIMANLPDRIVAHLTALNAEESKMALLDVADKFGIEASDNADESAIEQGIVAFVEDLQTKFADLQKKFDEGVKPPEKNDVPAKFVAREKKYRDAELEAVVKEGKIAPCVAKDLETIFCAEAEITTFLSQDDIPDNFENVIAALKKNEAIISFDGKTGPQRTEHLKGGENPLLNDVNKRREAAGMPN